MKKIILREKQFERVIDRLINEQSANEFYGSTDANTVSHSYLSKNFGLPDGSQHENYYYVANIEDVIAMSKDPNNRSKFLSIFEVANDYGDDPKDFYDYIEVNGNTLDDRGKKTFDFNSGEVYAAHNGLLALVRAMDRMGGKGGLLTIGFGRSKSGKDAESERESKGVMFDSNRALNQVPVINSIQDIFCSISINPKLLGMTTSMVKGSTKDQMINMLSNVMSNCVTGVYGFMDSTIKNEVITNLKPKGFITNIDFDFSQIVSELEKMVSVKDIELDVYGRKTSYNEEKRKRLNEIGKTYQNDLSTKLKAAYDANFKLYIENYLPNSKNKLLPLIKDTRFAIPYLGEWHYKLFHSTYGGSTKSSSTLQTSSGTYKTGG